MKKRSASKRILTLLLALVLALAYTVPASAAAVSQPGRWYDGINEMLAAGEYEEGVVIVGIDMSKAEKSSDPSSALDEKKLKAAAEEIMTVDGEDLIDESSERSFVSWLSRLKDKLRGESGDEVCITSIKRDDMTTKQLLKLLAEDDSVVFAEPNYITGPEDDSDDSAAAQAEDDVPVDISPEKTAYFANNRALDASRQQWSSSEDAALHAADKPCDVSMKVTGWPDGSNMDHEIVVAVVDLAVDFSNPDLKGQAYTFSPALQKKLHCDVHGYNALWDAKSEKLEYYEDGSHGSHVAGIIGASWDGSGVSGVGSNVKLISVQNSKSNKTSLVDTLRGYSFIKAAVENGVPVRIANNSWGQAQTSKAVDAAVTELGRLGIVSFFAAGNRKEDLNASANTSALADNPYAIVVASTAPSGRTADTTCYGRSIVTLGAPGAGILSTVMTEEAQYIPSMARSNKFYENFEGGEPAVSVCQVGFKAEKDEEYGYTWDVPDPDDPVSGTDGVVVSGSGEMGFEGRNILKVPLDRSEFIGEGDIRNRGAVRIHIGDVSKLGIKAGDMIGFAYGGKAEIEPANIVDTESGDDPEVLFASKCKENCFNVLSYTLSENIDTKDLTLVMEIRSYDAEEIYLDVFGIGGEKQPYGFMSGTSMASPAAAGAGAVIASRNYEELSDMESSAAAKRLAALVRTSVRQLESLRDITSTGGIIDLSVQAGASDAACQRGPDITDLALSGRTLTLTGTDFGSEKGSVTVRKYVVGNNTELGASVTSWTEDCAVVTLDEDFEGIIEAELASANGKKDSMVRFISKSSNVFGQDHHMGSETGRPLAFDEPDLPDGDAEVLGDFETSGLLVAGGGRLWYMPETGKVENNPACRTMYSYDPGEDEWTICPAYPSWIKHASGAWSNGKLYVKGTSVDVDESGTIPYYDEYDPSSGTASVYSYTPGDSEWERCSDEGVHPEQTLFDGGSRLLLTGSYDVEGDPDEEDEGYIDQTIREYDPAKGAGKVLARSPVIDSNPKAAYAGGYVYIQEYEYDTNMIAIDLSRPEADPETIRLPEYYCGEQGWRLPDYAPEGDDFCLASFDGTLIMTGPAAKDGSSDTYTLWAGGKALKPFSKRVSDAWVMHPAAAVLDGRLYVIGSSVFEPGRRVFRSEKLPVRKANTLTVKGKTAKVSQKKLKKKSQTVKAGRVMSVKKAKGKVTYKLKSVSKAKYRSYFRVDPSSGKVTVKKKLKKGTYKLKVRVTAAGNSKYKAASKNVTFRIRVK